MSVPTLDLSYPDRTEPPWKFWSETLCQSLWDHGLDTIESLLDKSNAYFREKVPGIGQRGVQQIREHIPDPRRPAKIAGEIEGCIERIPQPHGGTLQRGHPNPYRADPVSPSLVRAVARQGFFHHIHRLEHFASGTVLIPFVGRCEECGHVRTEPLTQKELKEAMVPFREQVRAMDVLGKYGIGSAKGVDEEEIVEWMGELGKAVQAELEAEFGAERGSEIAERVFNRWTKVADEAMG